MADKRKNIVNYQHELFRKLTRLFSGPISTRRQQTPRHLKRFQLDKYSTRIKSSSGQEFKKAMRTPWEQFSHNFYAECNRHDRYVDFSQMEFRPELASALDIYADEMTTASSLREMLTIKCTNQEIKHTLQNLYYNIMNIEHNLFGWCRSMCKFGDFFLYLDIDEKNGIQHVMGLPTEQVERLEGEDKTNPDYVQFQWNSAGLTLENWQMLHFRVLGNDKFIPYGQSILDPARRVYRQLCISEGTRIWIKDAGHKRIEDVKPGDVALSFDPNSGTTLETKVRAISAMGVQKLVAVHTAHRKILVTPNHGLLVKTKGGDFVYKKAEDLIVSDGAGGWKYHCADALVLPNKWAQENASYSVLIDDSYRKQRYARNLKPSCLAQDSKFTTTPEFMRLFGFMHGDGWTNKNGIGFALGVDQERNEYYDNIINTIFKLEGKKSAVNPQKNRGGQYKYHSKEVRIIFETLGFKTGTFNKTIPSWVYSLNQENKVAFIIGLMDADGCWNNKVLCLSNKTLMEDVRLLCQQTGIAVSPITRVDRKAGVYPDSAFGQIRRKESYKLYINLGDIDLDDFSLERVTRVIESGEGQTYDLEIDHEVHNFTAEGVISHNTLLEDSMMAYRIIRSSERRVFYVDVAGINPNDVPQYMEQIMSQMKRNRVVDQDSGRVDLRYNPMSVEEDYYIPVKGESQTKIETLSGGQNTTAIDDVKYLRNLMFSAIKIPASYLSADSTDGGGGEDKTTLSQKDIHFARTIQRLQKIVIAELEKAGVIHLFTLGFRGDDLTSFSLSLNNPSVIAELQELDRWKSKFDVAASATEGVFSKRWVATNLLGLSNEEFQRMQMERFYDKKIDAAVEASGESAAIESAPMGAGIEAAASEIGADMADAGAGEAKQEDEGGLSVVPPDEEQAFRTPQQLKQLSNLKFLRGVHRGHGRDGRTDAGPRTRHYRNLAGLETQEADPNHYPIQALRNLGRGMIEEGQVSIYSEEEDKIQENAGLVKLLEAKMEKKPQNG